MDEHQLASNPEAPAVPVGTARNAFWMIAIGAVCGGFLAFGAVVLSALDLLVSRFEHQLDSHILLPIFAGILLGSSLGFAFWVTRLKRHVPLLGLVASWGFVCGMFPVLLLALAELIFGWAIGVGSSGFPLRGPGPATPPMSMQAAHNAFDNMSLSVILFGIPVFAVGSLVGAVVAFTKWRRERNEKWHKPG